MHPHYSHIVDLILYNPGIGHTALFEICGITSKKAFQTEINKLIADQRIVKDDKHPIKGQQYAPKVLFIYFYGKGSDEFISQHPMNYLPSDLLQETLEYIDAGKDYEDSFEFVLQIVGFRLHEKYKAFFETHSNLFLDFDKYDFKIGYQFLYMPEGR